MAQQSAWAPGRVLVVVPTYNEAENIGSLLTEIIAQGDDIDVCVADDASPDGTAEVVRRSASHLGTRVQLLEGPEKRGRGAAVIAAFRRGLQDSRHNAFLEMDADFSHHPREIPRMLQKLETCDMVIGSRYIDGGGSSDWGVARPVLSWLANKYVALMAGMPVRDTTSGYRAYRRIILETIDFDRIRIMGYAVHGEIAYQAWISGFRIGEIPIHFRNRARQESKLTMEEIYTALWNFAALRFRYGFRPRKRPQT